MMGLYEDHNIPASLTMLFAGFAEVLLGLFIALFMGLLLVPFARGIDAAIALTPRPDVDAG